MRFMDAMEYPKLSVRPSGGPFVTPPLISTVRFTVPLPCISMRCTAPAFESTASSPGAPAARSVTPSPSRSPKNATDCPKKSLSVRDGPFGV